MALAPALTSWQSIALLAGVPLGLFLLIALAISAPGLAKRGRYRPGLGWDAAPVWFNGPEQSGPPAKPAEPAEPSRSAGGARATW